MLKNSKVVVVDDNEQRRQNLQVILEFLGETVVAADVDKWNEGIVGAERPCSS